MSKVIIYIAILFLFILAYVKYIEGRGIYFPIKELEFTPHFINLSFEDVYLKSGDNIKIHGWFIPAEQARFTILFCHGNAGNVGHRMEKLLLLHQADLNILIIDYRGYGRSSGFPSEKGIYQDAEFAYDYLRNERKLKPEDILLYGESLGCAAIIHLAKQRRVRALIAEGCFTKGKDMARRVYPFLPTFLFSDSFNNLARIKQVSCPKLFIHAREDEIVPFSQARRLYDAAAEPKELVELNGGHNSAFLDSQEKYLSAIRGFIKKL